MIPIKILSLRQAAPAERSLKVKALAAELAAERNIKVFFFCITLEPRVK